MGNSRKGKWALLKTDMTDPSLPNPLVLRLDDRVWWKMGAVICLPKYLSKPPVCSRNVKQTGGFRLHSSHFKAYDIVPKADFKSQCFILSWNISVLCYTFKTQDTGQSRRFSCVVRMVDPVRYRHFRKIKRTDRVKTGHVYGMS